jgi:hypothetical protein
MQFDPATRTRQIGNHPRIATMNTMGGRTAFGAPAISRLTICRNDDHVGSLMHRLHFKLGRDQIGKPKLVSHGARSPLEAKPVEPKISSRMSQTQYSTPKQTPNALARLIRGRWFNSFQDRASHECLRRAARVASAHYRNCHSAFQTEYYPSLFICCPYCEVINSPLTQGGFSNVG